MEKQYRKVNKTKSQLFEKIDKIDKFLTRLTKKKERRHKSSISEMKTGNHNSPLDVKRIIKGILYTTLGT